MASSIIQLSESGSASAGIRLFAPRSDLASRQHLLVFPLRSSVNRTHSKFRSRAVNCLTIHRQFHSRLFSCGSRGEPRFRLSCCWILRISRMAAFVSSGRESIFAWYWVLGTAMSRTLYNASVNWLCQFLILLLAVGFDFFLG